MAGKKRKLAKRSIAEMIEEVLKNAPNLSAEDICSHIDDTFIVNIDKIRRYIFKCITKLYEQGLVSKVDEEVPTYKLSIEPPSASHSTQSTSVIDSSVSSTAEDLSITDIIPSPVSQSSIGIRMPSASEVPKGASSSGSLLHGILKRAPSEGSTQHIPTAGTYDPSPERYIIHLPSNVPRVGERRTKEVDEEDEGINDARGINETCLPKPNQPVILHGSLESEEYCMTYRNLGKCIIFNHKEFSHRTGLDKRYGTDVDSFSLYSQFRDIGFHTTIYNDLTVRGVNETLVEASKEDHSDNCAFICCILTHGQYGSLFAQDGSYPTDNIFAPFTGDMCPSLVGKPKLFFLQACQGTKFDSGVEISYQESTDAGFRDSASPFKIPTHADFLIVYSTVPGMQRISCNYPVSGLSGCILTIWSPSGYPKREIQTKAALRQKFGFYSWRNTTYGTWFVQALCAALEEHKRTKDIIQILTIVNRMVAFSFESYVPTDISMHKKKQVPLITSTLTRELKFP